MRPPAAAAKYFLFPPVACPVGGLRQHCALKSTAQQYYLRARYYDPLNGRFNHMDPFAGNTQDPQSLHKYLYCHANPINGIDPSGYEFNLSGLLTTMSIITKVIALVAPAIVGMIGATMIDKETDRPWDAYVISISGGGVNVSGHLYGGFAWGPENFMSSDYEGAFR